jgi:NAD(P)-dependent dehydrogenase (short-subunit alcohol dehydrogenase family)
VDEVTQGQGINLLINNAGIFPRPQDSIAELNREALLKHFEVNTIGPIFLTKASILKLKIMQKNNMFFCRHFYHFWRKQPTRVHLQLV